MTSSTRTQVVDAASLLVDSKMLALPMRTPLLLAMVLLAVSSAYAQTNTTSEKREHRLQVSSRQCGLGTPFNVLADSGGIWLLRDSGSPREIFFHGGTLSVDHQVQQVNARDVQRLWEMEKKVRDLMPQVSNIARDVVNVTFDALADAARVITGDDQPPRKLRRQHAAALKYIDGTLGAGRWDQEVFDEKFEARMEDAIESYAHTLVRSALWQVVTGRGDKIGERADKLDDELDKRLDAQSAAIKNRAVALCTQVENLRQLQDTLEFRYEGQPLQMLSPVQDGLLISDIDVADDDAGSKPGNVDKPRDNAIEVQLPERK